ncbi:hypothetical protein WDW37_18680 [Bdellovibrionota bacterium FG-1]
MEHALESATPTAEPTKPHTRNPDRITINAQALERVNAWVDELEGRKITLSRNQLVNWLLCHHDTLLSPAELRGLETAFFDEVRFAEWALRELKATQSRGESTTLTEIIARHRPVVRAERKTGKTKEKRILLAENGVE